MPPIAQGPFDNIGRHESNSVDNSRHVASSDIIVSTKKSLRSSQRKMKEYQPETDSENSSVRGYFNSIHSQNNNNGFAVRNDLDSASLAGFYSSRRSLVSLPQENRKDIVQQQPRSPEKTKTQPMKQDISPRKPSRSTRRNSDGTIGHQSSVGLPSFREGQQRRSSDCSPRWDQSNDIPTSIDTAPRQPPPRRLSVEHETSQELLMVPQKQSLDSSPKKPIKRKSDRDIQEGFVEDNESDSKIDDGSPIRQNRTSLSDHAESENKEIHFSPAETIVVETRVMKKEFVVELPVHGLNHRDDDDKSHIIIKGCDNSVTSELTSPSFGEKVYSRLRGVEPPKLSVVNQRNAQIARRQPSLKSFDNSLMNSGQTTISKDSCSAGSIMSTQSYLTLSVKIRSLIELAADVVNAEDLEVATKHYQKAIHSAGSEIMSINIQMGNMIIDENQAGDTAQNAYHEDLRLIGIIIGMLRNKMAILYSHLGEYERAIDLCKGAVQVHKHQPVLKSISNDLSDTDDVVGLMVLIIERLESAQTMFESYKELQHKMEQDFEDDVFEVLSVHTAKKSKHDEGVMYLRDALQIHLVALGLKHPHTSKSLLHIARMYRGVGNDRNNEQLVLGYFQQTAAVLERSNLNQQSRVSILNDIAVIHMRRKMFDEAIKFLLDALHAFDEMEKVDEAMRGKNVGTLQIWRNLGECYMQLFKFKSAEGSFLKALHIQRDCVKIHEAAERLDINALKINESILKLSNDVAIADTICQIGKARAGGGNQKQALDIYREALRVLNRNATADRDRTDEELLKKRDQLTHLLFCIAEAERDDDEIEKALQMYHLSLKLRRSHGSDVADKRKTTSIHCLSCFLGIIDIYIRQKKFQEAKNEIKNAMDFRVQARIKQTHPVVLAIRKKAKDCQLAITDAAMRNPDIDALEKKADTEIERGALDMAIETLRRLLIIRRAALKELKEKGQDTRDQVYAIACLLQTFGFVFAKNGDDENSERAFKDASRLFRKGGIPNEPSASNNLVQL